MTNKPASDTPPTTARAPRSSGLVSDPLWYKDAVIFQVHVKAFQDSNGDGIGDFRGLVDRLDYIQALGATAIWLLPFYPSPLRDDGYDIADYRKIHPAYGTMRDFRRFVKEAHRRGLRVITELVINHTSDQHPWFQKARRAKPGSAARNFYVWSDTDQRYQGTRIIFLDTEKSNWTWDPEAQAYFWHRFYSHQPDLNFDNPRVLEEVIKIMRYWLDMGVDGLRLDAIPYLVEREGTNNENLPETHTVLKKIRGALDASHNERMLLAEANQWPEDTASYFGDGDECHMAFHFPLMPRIYMALAQEDRYPIADIIRQMPDIPENCQWAIFLRNHDELTLEMVTEDERDYLWQTYASDARARINLGIRRRLAPLMQNDRRKIELMKALLLSMPGSPILYYGDEIGMGDNFYLGDRDGVRTPMQWTADRNCGFSRANPHQLYLPPIMDPVYGYQSTNVEAQENDPSSLLNWTRRMVAVRAQYKAFGRGTISFLYPANRKILAYIRSYDEEHVLCVANLARTAEAVELDLSRFCGAVPVELTGRTSFPPIGDLPYLLTLPAYGFFWFGLEPEGAIPHWHEPMPEMMPELITLTTSDGTIQSVFTGRERRQLERDILPKFLPLQRWFAGKQGDIDSVSVRPLGTLGDQNKALVVADIESEGTTHSYFVPLAIVWGEENIRGGAPVLSHTLAKARKGPYVGAIVDAAMDGGFVIDLFNALRTGKTVTTKEGRIEFDRSNELRRAAKPTHARRVGVEQSNISIVLDEEIMLKIYRRLQTGVQPDVEVGRFLRDSAAFHNTPQYLGSATYETGQDEATTLATVFAFVHNQGDAWTVMTEAFAQDLESAALAHDGEAADQSEPSNYPLTIAGLLGLRTGELHAAFAKPTDDPAFSSTAVRKSDIKAWSRATAQDIRRTFSALRKYLKTAPQPVQQDIQGALAAQDSLLERVKTAEGLAAAGGRSRIHGDYHLGQVLICHDDLMIVDFEGEPQRPFEQRRTKTSPLRDVAGMLRSFDYLAWTVLDRRQELTGDLRAWEHDRVMRWRDRAVRDFLDAYIERVSDTETYSADRGTSNGLLQLFIIQKAVYEIGYELANRPAWVSIPIRGLLDLLKQDATTL